MSAKVITRSLGESAIPNPKSMTRPKQWSVDVEEAYRFQVAGYRDANEYKHHHSVEAEGIDRWPHNGYVKKLKTKEGYFYYYNKDRECPDREIHKTKMYAY